MDSQAAMLLYLLLFASVLLLVLRARMSFAWTWAFGLQNLLVLSLALAGLTAGRHWFFVTAGWSLFLLFFIMPRFIHLQIERNIATLNQKGVCRWAHRLEWLYWGEPGRFAMDMAQAISFYISGNKEQAEAMINKYEVANLPKPAQETLHSYRMMGNIILWNWHGIIDEYETLKAQKQKIEKRLVLAAGRAYAELGQIVESAQCIEAANLPESRLSVKTLAATLLPFFCLGGAREKTDTILAMLNGGVSGLTDYSKLYWRGRVFAVCGQEEKARECLESSLKILNGKSLAWQSRINAQIDALHSAQSASVDWQEPVKTIWQLFERCIYIQDILTPANKSKCVFTLVLLIVGAYFISDCYSFFPCKQTGVLKVASYSFGMLMPERVLAGEYWRLFTYLFLHGHLLHVVLNVLGLYWFGRIAENIFGTVGFLFIYIIAGILSGVAHVLLSPQLQAIGASGAVMGVFGAVAVGIFRLKDTIPPAIRRTELAWMFGLAASQLVMDQFIPHVAAFAHLGGLLSGALLALLLPIKTKVRQL